jgi:predicted permease
MRSSFNEVRIALRQFRKHPGFPAIAIFTLACGIGASTVVYSLVNAVLLAPLPYLQPERLVRVYSSFPASERFALSPPELFGLRERMHGFAGVGAYIRRAVSVAGRLEPVRVPAANASADLLSTLGVRPRLGRLYSAAEDRPGGPRVVMLSEGLWRRALGAEPRIVGESVSIDGVQRTVVGVMPLAVGLEGRPVDVWLPLELGADDARLYGAHMLNVVARLRGGSLDAARHELDALVARWPNEAPAPHTPNPVDHPLRIVPLLDDLVGEVRPALLLLSVAAGFLLLIACANVAGLLVTRAEARHREMAVRAALGAGRGRLLRQFLTESVLLGLAAVPAGVLLAWAGVRALVALHPESIPRFETARVDLGSLLFAAGVALATAVVFSLASGLHAGRRPVFTALKDDGARATAGAARQGLRRSLVVLEIALAALLLAGTGLLVRSFSSLLGVDKGFQTTGVLSLRLSPAPVTYRTSAQVLGFYHQVLDGLERVRGVESVAAIAGLPPQRELDNNDMVLEGVAANPAGPPRSADYWQFVTRDYFELMHIRLVRGRLFDAADGALSPGVALINETMARRFWPGRDPVGKRLRQPGDNVPWLAIVGVVRDVKQGGIDKPAGTEVFFLLDQARQATGGVPRSLYVLLRGRRPPASLAAAARDEVHRVDPTVPVSELRPLQEVVSDSLARPRFVMFLAGVFAAVALLLALVGTYGVLADSVARRRGEIGVRLALGARRADVHRMVLGQGLRLVAAGAVLGVAFCLALGRLLSGLLFGISPADPASLAGAAALLVAVGLWACYVPARRATRTSPMEALRVE